MEQKRAQQIYAMLPYTEHHQRLCEANIGMVLVHWGKYAEAVAKLSNANLVGREQWWSQEYLAQAEERLRHWPIGRRLQCIKKVEAERKAIHSPEHQISWFENKSVVYENTASLLLRMGRERVLIRQAEALKWGSAAEEIALHFADRGKGRTLLELVSTRALHTGDKESSSLLAERLRLAGEIANLLKRRGLVAQAGKEKEFEDLTQKIEQKQAKQREIEVKLRRTAAGAFIEPPLLKPAEFCKMLKPDEACLEYVACKKELLIFVVMTKGVKAFLVEIDRDVPRALLERRQPSIEKLVSAYRQSPDRPETLGLEGLVWLQREWMDNWRNRALSEGEHVAVSHALGKILLPGDLRKTLADENIKHLVIVPSRVLAFISFSGLVVAPRRGDVVPKTLQDSQFLVEDYSLSYVQSLSLLNVIRKRVAERTHSEAVVQELVAFADPIYDNSDPRSAGSQPKVQLAQAEVQLAGVDAVVRGLVRNVGIAPDAGTELRWDRLPETRLEAETAAKSFGDYKVYENLLLRLPEDSSTSAICIGYAANRPLALSEEVGRYRHLLFGVHGYTDTSNPWLSCLMLTDLAALPGQRQPAPLTMADVFSLRLNADAVVLAACQTALGRMRAGEGVVGFALAFGFAGADTVILTQWEVPSKVKSEDGQPMAYPTRDVVVGFYQNWREDGHSRARALRQAQLKVMRRGGRFADPFYWGAWQLFGEWR